MANLQAIHGKLAADDHQRPADFGPSLVQTILPQELRRRDTHFAMIGGIVQFDDLAIGQERLG